MKPLLFFALLFCSFSPLPASHRVMHNHARHHVHKEYQKLDAWGMCACVDLPNCNPDLIRSKEVIIRYVHELCDLIEMKRFGETVVIDFGEDERVAGFSMTQLIETSLISGHFANATNTAYIDIFSCKPYDPEVVARFTQEYFQSEDPTVTVVLRK